MRIEQLVFRARALDVADQLLERVVFDLRLVQKIFAFVSERFSRRRIEDFLLNLSVDREGRTDLVRQFLLGGAGTLELLEHVGDLFMVGLQQGNCIVCSHGNSPRRRLSP